MSERVYDAVFDSLEHSVSHGSTFAPNDLAMAAGLATLRELDDARLVEQSARLGELLLERTRELAAAHDVVRDVRGLGLMWAMEFAEPESGSFSWRVMERMQTGLFAQLVVVPLFTKHHILSQVAGHDLPVLKGLPPLVVSEQDLDDLVSALDDVIAKAGRPSRIAGMALRAARAR
jgi:ornithine--oxo-acid transaminase